MEILMMSLLVLLSCIAGVAVFLYYNAGGEARRWERVDTLEADVARLTRRVVALEANSPVAVASPRRSLSDFSLPPTSAPPPRAASAPAVPPSPAPVPVPAAEPPRAQAPAESVPASSPATSLTLEERIGGQWLNWLGAVTLVFTVGLFLKWAYDMGWITPLFHLPPLAYLCCGWLAGAGLLLGGELLARRLPLYAQGLIGAGTATLYVTTYAGNALYHTLSASVATSGLVLVGAVAIGMALRHNSVVVAWLGVTLAYISPLLLGGGGPSPTPLFLYLSMLNVAVLGISVARRWSAFRLAALLASSALYGTWHLQVGGGQFLGLALVFVMGNALLFLLVLALPPLLRREPATESDLALAALNPLLSFVALYHLLQPAHAEWHGLIALAYAAVHGGLSRVARIRLGGEDYLERILFGIAAAFVLLTIPLQWDGNVITAGWALLGAAMGVVGYQVDSRRTVRWGATYVGLAAARLGLVDVWKSPPPDAWAFLNERGASFAVVIFSLLVMAGMIARRWLASGHSDESAAGHLTLVGAASGALLNWWLFLDAPTAWFPAGWAVVGGLLFTAGWRLQSRDLRWIGLAFSLLPTAYVVLAVGSREYFPQGIWRFPAWIAAMALSVALAACYQRDESLEAGERQMAVPLFAGTAALVALIATAETLDGGWVSLAWLGIGALLLGVGVRINRSSVWMLALPVAVLMTARFVTHELVVPPNSWALFHSRSVAALATLAAWIAFTRTLARHGAGTERGGLPVLIVLTNLQALGWLSLEAMDIAGRIGPTAWAREASQFALSAVWVAYAAGSILLGLRRSSSGLRWGGMGLLLVTVAKVYLFDLGFLPLGYRVLSFLVLALVLLGVSYLYQRRTASVP